MQRKHKGKKTQNFTPSKQTFIFQTENRLSCFPKWLQKKYEHELESERMAGLWDPGLKKEERLERLPLKSSSSCGAPSKHQLPSDGPELMEETAEIIPV